MEGTTPLSPAWVLAGAGGGAAIGALTGEFGGGNWVWMGATTGVGTRGGIRDVAAVIIAAMGGGGSAHAGDRGSSLSDN